MNIINWVIICPQHRPHAHGPSSMFGVLVDVSGSMENAFALDKLHRDDVSVERTHAVFTTVAKIVEREVAHHERPESIFACAFGLEYKPAPVCNLIELFTKLRDSMRVKRGLLCAHKVREELVELAMQHNGAHAEEWIRHHLEDNEVVLLYWLLREEESLIPKLLEKIPSTIAVNAARLKCNAQDTAENAAKAVMDGARKVAMSVINPVRAVQGVYNWWTSPPQMPLFIPPSPTRWDRTVHDSEAYQYAREIMSEKSSTITDTLLKPIELRSVQYVSKLMKELNAASDSSSSWRGRHNQIQELVDEIKPFIYGGTPMRKAMIEALHIFRQASAGTAKVLFVLSDGESADGDPLPIAQELKALGVCIVTCYLTSDDIDNPKSMFYEPIPDWGKGQLDLFKMSSTMKNTHTPVSYLIDAGWELPSSGESRLFVQANSLKVVNELCETVVAHLTESCDALVDVLGKVPLATYINQANASFTPRDQQQEATCYAHAIAATFHLAMHRIVGRDGGVPDFNTVRDRLICEYGKDGANTGHVLQAVCPEYRLQFKKVDETGARQAINQRRPVVARLRLYPKQWDKFEDFFTATSKGILKKTDIQTNEPATTKNEGHAVVLIRCDPDCLTFMNSWGTDWADGGFFRIQDQSVCNKLEFYDVYWTEDDLTDSEKQAYKIDGTRRAKQVMEELPSIKDLEYQCPKCNIGSEVQKFSGNLLEAECPRCHQVFQPTNQSILESLYSQNMNY